MDPDRNESTIAEDLAAIVRLAEVMKAAEIEGQRATDEFFATCARRAAARAKREEEG